ncbi:MAG: inositol monophosphatase [Rhizobiales bacterium]|nr:inositol monophosphatase [Hyphomicrobiales bacterium]
MQDAAIGHRFLAAQAIAREAGQTMRRRFLDRSSFTLKFKGRQDYLTEVDGEVEAMVKGRLAGAFPGDGLIGEEGGAAPGAAGAGVWVIDPIDGTANFARGIPHFCISIAYVLAGQIEIGVIYDPMMDEMFAGRRGGGASLNGARMEVTSQSEMTASTIEIGWNMRSGMAGYHALVGKVIEAGAGVMRCGSGALGVAYVAAGRIDAYLEQHMNAWDVLAGLCLVTEAGGVVNDFLARDGLTRGNEVLASGPVLAPGLSQLSGIALAQRG